MLSTKSLVNDYATLSEGSLHSLGLAKPYCVEFECTQNKLLDAEQVQQLLPSLTDAEGWAQFTDRNTLLPAKQTLSGMLLEAEYNYDNLRYRLKYCDNNQWQWQSFTVSRTEDDSEFLALDAQHLLDGYAHHKFHYQNIWQLSADKGLQPITSVLEKVTSGEKP